MPVNPSESQVDKSVRAIEGRLRKAAKADLDFIFYRLPLRLSIRDRGYLQRKLMDKGYEVVFADKEKNPCAAAGSAFFFFVKDKEK